MGRTKLQLAIDPEYRPSITGHHPPHFGQGTGSVGQELENLVETAGDYWERVATQFPEWDAVRKLTERTFDVGKTNAQR